MGAQRRSARAVVAHATLWLLLLSAHSACCKKKAEGSLLQLTDETLQAALQEHPLLLISVSVPDCEVCAALERQMKAAEAQLRVQAKNAVVLGRLKITSADSPVLARIVQGALTLPKLIIFREGEAMDYVGSFDKASILETMLRETSRDTIQGLRSVKQTERFLHLDSWSSQHADDEKPPRVVGFFPSNESAAYAVYRTSARKLQGLISFGECFDPTIQRKFLGSPTRKPVIQLVKADKRERKLTYSGPLAPAALSRWIATHSVALVQDLSTESSIESHMAIGVPLFLLLMPDSYEEELGELIVHFRSVAARVREKLLFGYGFKDTEPWPQFAQQLGIDHSSTGAFWMIVGSDMTPTGRDWSTAWLRPPSLGFQIYAMEARGKETAADVTEEKIWKFVNKFLSEVERFSPPDLLAGQVEVEEEEAEAVHAAPQGAEGDAAARNYDKLLRERLSSLQMNFNSGIANVKKVPC
uniref:protein disulfide-isomerase n=1 Tax=Chrysotila carterae TaxID=13221 RepID=A0A7S4F4T9_CHRCT